MKKTTRNKKKSKNTSKKNKSEESDVFLGYCTVPTEAIGKKIAQDLIQENLIACLNIIPDLTSIYRWKGQVRKDKEFLCLIKTQKTHIQEIIPRIQKIHPYEVPEIIFHPIHNGLPIYMDWIRETTTKKNNRT